MTYDLTALNDVTDPVGYFLAINTMSNGLLGGVILVLFYFILLISVEQESMPTVMLAVSFAMSILTLILWNLGLVPLWMTGINITFLVASILIKMWGRN